MVSDGVGQSRVRRAEQRANRRRNVPVRCWVSDGDVDRFASLADISLDGARLFTAAPPVVGRRVSLRFSLRPRGAEVRAEARVVWRSEGFRGRGGVVGVQFASISAADEIAAYVGEG
jgi:hypothetical protein